MITRRLLLVPAAAAGVLALSSCSSVATPAATVDGAEISMDEFESAVVAVTQYQQVQQGGEAEDLGVVDGELSRRVLSIQIEHVVLDQELERTGNAVDADDLAAEEAALSSSAPAEWDASPEAYRALLIELSATRTKFDATTGPGAAEIEALYQQGPAASGFVCVSHILVASQDEADAVLDRLDAGEEFGNVAAEVSTDASAAANGGALLNQGAPCYPLPDFQVTFVPEFVDGALAAEVGVPTEPVESEFGFHVILLRPFDEVGAEVVDAAQSTAAATVRRDLLAAADVSVHSSIGEWAPASGAVLALGSA